MKNWNRDTVCVQGGYNPGNGEPRQIPIIQSTTFKYATSEDMGKLFDLEASGYFYSRLQNPTCDTVAAKICELEGGTAAMLTSSGQAASFYAIFNIASCGDHIVSSSTIYGGTYNLFAVTMKRMGIDFTFVSPDCTKEELDAAFRPNTKAVFGETIANPALTVLDFEKFASAAHEHGVPLIVDNTFATPVNCRPFEWGADIVTHSTTKYMDGHGAAVGGCIVDSGRFDWTKYPEKYPGLCTPDDSYHGVTYTERFGIEGAYITKATVQLMRDFGSVQSPQNAFILNLGLESLHVRMARHCENALAVAKALNEDDRIAYVVYPGLEGDKYYKEAQKYMPNGTTGVVSFGLKGGRKAAEAFMKNLKIAAIETHVADARTCCLHPASSTHRQMTEEELMQQQALQQIVDAQARRARQEDIHAVDLDGVKLQEVYSVGIRLDRAIDEPNSDFDVVLRDGDIIYVPEYNATARVLGAVLYPNTVTYTEGKSVKYYVKSSGGFDNAARKRGVFIIHMNGMVEAGLRAEVRPGSIIVVPTKTNRGEFRWSDIVQGISSTASMTAVVLSAISLTK